MVGPISAKHRTGEDRSYLLDDESILWHVPKKEDPKLAIPRPVVPGVLALVHSTIGHPGVAGTVLLVRRAHSWPTLVGDVREYVLLCG